MAQDRERDDLLEISAELKQDREKSWMVWDGRMKEGPDGTEQEDWIALPKVLCNRLDDNTFEVPYWLAKEKGLI